MKQLKLTIVSLLLLGVVATVFESCKEDEPPALVLSGLTIGDQDLNGATSPTDVALDAVITATFSTNVDPATATADNITLVREYDGANVELTINVSGNTITIIPNNALLSGNLHTLTISAAVGSDKSKLLGTETTRTFTTAGFFSPNGQIAYWNFNDNIEDQVGSFDADPGKTIAVTFVEGRKTAAGKAGSFNGTTSIAEVPNANQFMTHNSFAISFWVKINSTKQGHFVLGLAGYKGFQFEVLGGPWSSTTKGVKLATQYQLASTTSAEDTWWNGNPNGWQGSTFAKDVSGSGGIASYFQDKWAHVVCMYDAAEKIGSMYVNGEKVRSWDFDLWPDGDAKRSATGVVYAGNTTGGANNLAFGFVQATGNPTLGDTWADYTNTANNHFMGLLDDVRIFENVLTENEITLIYNSEKP